MWRTIEWNFQPERLNPDLPAAMLGARRISVLVDAVVRD